MLCVGGSSSRAERAEELKATNKEEWQSESLSAWGTVPLAIGYWRLKSFGLVNGLNAARSC